MSDDENSTEKEPQQEKTEVVAELTTLRQKNSQALSKLRELFTKVSQEKASRDSENAIVKTTAGKIEETRKELNAVQEKLTKLDVELKPLKEQFGSPDKINVEIRALEYSLNINYSLQREKVISKQVSQLSKQLKAMQASVPKLKEQSQLRHSARDLRTKLGELVKDLKAHANQSEEHHHEMLAILKTADELQTTLPKALTELDEKRGELIQLTAVETEQRKKDHAEFEAQRKQTKQIAAKKLNDVKIRAKEIMEKFKTGKPISFEELQVLQVAGIEI
ncbi:MAG: hypothetical protein V1722_04175 [Candidatus Micrarchaeota archaeon]